MPDESSDPEYVANGKRIENAVALLAEHLDTVVVLASSSTYGCTDYYYRQCGDWYAAVGLATRFLAEDDEDTRLRMRPSSKGDDPMDGAEWL